MPHRHSLILRLCGLTAVCFVRMGSRQPVEEGSAAYDDIRKDINVLLCVRYVGTAIWQCSGADDGRGHDGRDDVADGYFSAAHRRGAYSCHRSAGEASL